MHPQSLQTTQTAPPLNAQPQAPPPPPPQPQPQDLKPQTLTTQQPNRAKREAPGHGQLQRVIPPEEDMRRLFQECRIANGNAQLLNEALAFASPEDLREKDIIKVRARISLSRSKGPDDLLRNGIRSASLLGTCLQHKYHGRQQERIGRVLLVKLNYRCSNSNSVQPNDRMDWGRLIC
jgi:hypothetical protein